MIQLHEKITSSYQEEKNDSLRDFSTIKVSDIPDFLGDKRSWSDYPGRHWSDCLAERHLYYRIAKDLGPGNYADIGVWRGGSSASLANGLFDGNHQGAIYAVDFFGSGNSHGRDFGASPETLLTYMRSKKLDSLVDLKICQGNSIEIGKQYQNITFNFISIDGDHSYSGCKADFEVWSPMIKQNGLIAFNDICCLSVDRVIREMNNSKWKFVRQIFNTKVFERTAI